MNMFKVVYFLIIMMGLASCENDTMAPPEMEITSVDSLINAQTKQGKFDGTVLIANKDSIIYQSAFGVADRVWDIPTQLDHVYDIASLNKAFIAVLILQQQEKGNLFLHQKVVDFIPDLKGNYADLITIHQLLTHTSGLPDYDAVGEALIAHNFRTFKRQHFTNKEYVAFISQLVPRSKPGEKFYYSNFGYHLLTIILEQVSGISFSQLLNEAICEPLNLSHTYSPITTEKVYKKQVEAYNWDSENGKFERNQFIDFTLGRRIYATVGDLYKWSLALSYPSEILTKASINLLKKNQLTGIESGVSYGYGWYVFDGGNYERGNLNVDTDYLIHGGSTEGFKAMMTIMEDPAFTVIHLSNIGDQTNEFDLTKMIVHQLIPTK